MLKRIMVSALLFLLPVVVLSGGTAMANELEIYTGANHSYGNQDELFPFAVQQSTQSGLVATASNTNSVIIEGTKLNLEHLEFYESGLDEVDLADRIYRNMFAQRDARIINLEIELSHISPGYDIDFLIRAVYYWPDGSREETSLMSQIGSDWTGSGHSGGLGFEQPGKWEKGNYTVEIYINNVRIATGGFIIGDYYHLHSLCDIPGSIPSMLRITPERQCIILANLLK